MRSQTIRAMGELLALGAVATLILVGGPATAAEDQKAIAEAQLEDASGKAIGRVYFFSRGPKTIVSVQVSGVSPGFHGLHVHAVGYCHHDFVSAGGHFNPTGGYHGDHAGDLPPLLVNADGTAYAVFVTDRFTVRQLLDADGSAVILHAARDNLAHIPARYWSSGMVPEGYAGGPDPVTLATGDAGARVACGVVH